MAPFTIGLLALSMSVDAFDASIGRGAGNTRHGLAAILATGLAFGVIEAITPLIGWSLGMVASRYVQAIDHWIAFGLLASVGLHMAYHALTADEDAPPQRRGWWPVVVTAIGTSLDAMAVGASLAFIQVNILVIAGAIGLATMAMSTLGLMLGRLLGQRFGRATEVVVGIVLVIVGLTILTEHLASA
ncbi:manganese efflux pump MntP family protein [Paenirhodobacter sp.]|uniref:manganese efflux pump MntP n=1 Tax=Paenirhodobacter sp. TaxID=1965326 RepID=UPI003B4032E7